MPVTASSPLPAASSSLFQWHSWVFTTHSQGLSHSFPFPAPCSTTLPFLLILPYIQCCLESSQLQKPKQQKKQSNTSSFLQTVSPQTRSTRTEDKQQSHVVPLQGTVQLYCGTVQGCCPLCWRCHPSSSTNWCWTPRDVLYTPQPLEQPHGTAEGEAQTASLGAGAKRKVQLCNCNPVQLENFSTLPKLTSTVKKHIHVGTDLVICDNTAKMDRQLGCNWIWPCVAKDLSLSESPDLGWGRQHIC